MNCVFALAYVMALAPGNYAVSVRPGPFLNSQSGEHLCRQLADITINIAPSDDKTAINSPWELRHWFSIKDPVTIKAVTFRSVDGAFGFKVAKSEGVLDPDDPNSLPRYRKDDFYVAPSDVPGIR